MANNLAILFNLEKQYRSSNHLENLFQRVNKYLQSDEGSGIKRSIDNASISIEEAFPIMAYSSSQAQNFASKVLNCSLRNNSQNEFEEYFIRLLDEALLRLTPYNNNEVYRMVDDFYMDDIASQIQFFRQSINECFIVNHFLSTSKVNWHNRMTWKINTNSQNSKARNIESFINHNPNGEREVLFCRGSKFKIQSVQEKSGYTQVNLIEISTTSSCKLIFKSQLECSL